MRHYNYQDYIGHFLSNPVLFFYQIIQLVLDRIFAPTPPPPGAKLSRPKIAVIGAGLTGVSAASHCVGHGFETTIFEAGDRKALGGIWSVKHLSLVECSWPIADVARRK